MSIKQRHFFNCENCMATYEKPANLWVEVPMAAITKGLCEFCEGKSRWFVDRSPCTHEWTEEQIARNRAMFFNLT